MTTLLVSEILSAHADQLNRGEKVKTDALLATFPGERDEVSSLMNIASRLKRALQPASIAPQFRAHLREGLTMAVEHRASQRILIDRRDSTWNWVLGAAALGSAAGLIAIAWRSRSHRQPVASIVHESTHAN